MKQLYTFLAMALLLLCGHVAVSQSLHTEYFNEEGREVEPGKALYKVVTEEDSAGSIVSTRYLLKDNSKLRQHRYKHWAQGKKLKYGTHYEWFAGGQVKLETNFRNDSLTGPHTRWYENGQVHISRQYHRYQLVDTLKSYFPSGALRRVEVYDNGKMLIGRVYNEAGEEVKHTPMEVMPEFPGGEMQMFRWVGKNVRYPGNALKAGIQGIVVVSFMVDTTGQISKIEMLQGLHPDCEAEAIRVVKQFPKFKPGTIEGVPTEMTYIFPLRFATR
ncbi:energy transducer TonB [Pontibacter virosus]|uniref:TonB family protein n=1 Tax=Pontibacter virosus TaxID=1765052 RepID=A0A2U1AVM4_9BACT|nr:energy transducer TonB [Pontibacter virosus]PVY40499.1 TonB family protein [Pontibacter virosus]